MIDVSEKVVIEALHLPRESRALLAEKLLESLDYDEEFAVSPEWRREIQERCREIDDGVVELVDADAVFAELDKTLG